MKRLVLSIALAAGLVGCGASQQQTTEAYRVALAVARHMCRVVEALPDAPAPTTGGEAPP